MIMKSWRDEGLVSARGTRTRTVRRKKQSYHGAQDVLEDEEGVVVGSKLCERREDDPEEGC